MSSFETNPKKIKEDLLNLVYIRDIALPDFQCDFVWLRGKTVMGFPIAEHTQSEHQGKDSESRQMGG